MKKTKYKFNCISLLIILCILTIVTPHLDIQVSALEMETEVSSENFHSTIDISDEFDDSSVIVVLDKKISGINKNHEKSFFNGVDIDKIEDLTKVTDESTVNKNNFEQILLLTLSVKSKENVINTIEILNSIDGIKYAGTNATDEYEIIPNDALYFNSDLEKGQWALDKISAPDAWKYTTGSNDVRVGIMDTGIAYHEDLNDRVVASYDFYSTTSDNPIINRIDDHSHGTHVAGIVGGEGNNSIGISGVNWDVSLIQMRVGKTGFNRDAVVRALNWAKNQWNTENRISIISYSSGVYEERPDYEAAIRGYTDVGGLFVCSTGNLEQDNDIEGQHHYPSFYGSNLYSNPIQNMITVGRSNIYDNKPTGANWGSETIMLYAPGHNIVSTYPQSMCNRDSSKCNSKHIDYGYHLKSGSSMATPYVSGVAALLLSINKNLTAGQIKNAILSSVDIPDVDGLNPLEDLCVTDGRLNAYNAVKYVLDNYSSSTTLKYNTKTLSGSVDSTSTFFNEKNYFLKMNVENAYEYDFTISSSSALEVTLYNSNFNEINVSQTSSNGGLTKTLSYYLSVGTYYLQSNYVSSTASGTINVSIVGEHTHSYTYSPSTSGHIATCTECDYTTTLSHVYDHHNCIHCGAYTATHDYDMNYEWVSYTMHSAECSCGEVTTQGHAVASGSYNTGQRYATCLLCGGLAEMGFVQWTINSSAVTKVTINGSFILPNGVIVLEDEDLDAYLNGTLVFYDKDNVPLLQ